MTPDRIRPALRASEAAVLRVELECFPDVSFDKLDLETLAFYLNGESAVVHGLYELLCRNCVRILVRDPANPKAPVRELPVRNLQPMGFGDAEDVLPYPRRSFVGYRLLQEYSPFQKNFFFMSLKGLSELQRAGLKSKAEILFLISPFEQDGRHQAPGSRVNAKTLRLGCTPSSTCLRRLRNRSWSIRRAIKYPIVPDARRRQTMEIYSVDEVVSTDAETHETGPIIRSIRSGTPSRGPLRRTGTLTGRFRRVRAMKGQMFFFLWSIFRLAPCTRL